jgi:putative transposase
MYPFRTIDCAGDTIEFFFSEHRDLSSAKRFIRKEVRRHGRPEQIIIDGSQTNGGDPSPATVKAGYRTAHGGR